jgi:hypothetical protein
MPTYAILVDNREVGHANSFHDACQQVEWLQTHEGKNAHLRPLGATDDEWRTIAAWSYPKGNVTL